MEAAINCIIITGARNQETHHNHHRGQHFPVSEAVRGYAERKCGLILRHFPARFVRSYSHLHLLIISKPAALC